MNLRNILGLSMIMLLNSGYMHTVQEKTLNLAEVDLSHMQQGWNTAKKNKTVADGTLVINGRKFSHGVGTHAASILLMKLDGHVESFKASVGLTKNQAGASVEFLVVGDDEILWRSGTMTSGDSARLVDVKLAGVKALQLKVTDAGDGIDHDHAAWCDASFTYSGEKPASVNPNTLQILTPKPQKTPRINGAKVFGVRPGSPFFFLVPVSGIRPMKIMAEGLPRGLEINSETGVISGKIHSLEKKTYTVNIQAKNKLGKAKGSLRIVVGDTICLTPPMGWNSWYGCSEGVSAQQVKEVADAFVESGLREHGWTFVNIDDCWQGPRDEKTKVLMGNERFPDMKELCDYVHGLGLKIGIYSSPWVGTYAGFRGGSCDNEDGTYPKGLDADKRLQPNQIYGRYPGHRSFNGDRIGKYWFFDRDMKALAEWGFDYIKVDWKPNDVPTATRMANDLLNSGRDIILSLSNAAPLKNAPGLSKVSNLWRTGGDIHDHWGSISRCFESSLPWQPFQSPGHWNDMDMLQVGMKGVPNRFNSEPKATHLTPDEQYTQMTMWSLQSNPLLLSCYVHLLDEFTLSLLTNDEVIEVNQDPLGNPALRNRKEGEIEVWSKKLEDGSMAVGLFNRGDSAAEITVNWSDLHLKGSRKVRDLWRQNEEGSYKKSYKANVNSHGVKLIKISN